MRVLLHPHTGLRNIRGDSNYLLFVDIARYLTLQGHFVHMIMPEFSRDSVERMDGLMYHFVDFVYDFYEEYGIYEPRQLVSLFSRTVGKYLIDTVVTAKANLVPVYRSLLSDLLRAEDVACYVVEPSVYTDETFDSKGLVSLMQTSVGYAYSKTVFLSPDQKDIAIRTARRFLSSDLMRQMDKNGLVLSVGVQAKKLDALRAEVPEKYDKFTLFYGARMHGIKHPEKIIDLYADLHAAIPDSQVVMTTSTPIAKFKTKYGDVLKGKESAFDIQFSCPRDEYLHKAVRAHVGICWSETEGFPVGFWEQMYMGVPVLFTDKPWSRSQLPAWYPFMFKTKDEAFAMVQYIRENYDQVQREVMEPMRELIRDKYDDSVIYRRLVEEMYADLAHKLSYNMPKGMRKVLLDCVTLFEDEEFTMPMVLSAMEQVGTAFDANQLVRANNPKFPTNYDVYRTLLVSGYRDVSRAAKPRFQKVPDWDGEESFL